MSFMTIRQGSSLIFVETASGDTTGLSGNPTGYLVQAAPDGKGPLPGATPMPLTVVQADTKVWQMKMLNTTSLALGSYYAYSRYTFSDGTVYLTEPTLVQVKA